MTGGRDEGGPSTDVGASWTARVWADRDHYDLVAARAVPGGAPVPPFPADAPVFEVVLGGEEVRIGRRGVPDDLRADGALPGAVASRAGPDEAPGIDLTGPPRDPGVSHRHAALLGVAPDRWVVLDTGSTNGTSVNYAAESLTPGVPVPLTSGDRIHVGAWTTITVERR